MELLAPVVSAAVLIAVLIGPWVAFAALAMRFGVDSRPGLGDERSVGAIRWI